MSVGVRTHSQDVQPIRITILTGPFLPTPPAPCGAVERVWHGLAEEFAARGHPVTVVSRAWPGLKPDETVNGVRHVRVRGATAGRRLPVNLAKDFAYAVRAVAALPPADVLVTNSFWAPVLAGFRRGVGKIVVHMARMPKGQLWLYDRVSRIQVVSSAVRDTVAAERPTLLPKVRVMPNVLDPVFLRSDPRPPRSAGPLLLFAGRIHPEKGLDLLIDAFAIVHARLPAVRLKVMGPWQVEQGGAGGEYLDALRRRASGRPVAFADPVFDRTALAAEYRAADVLCYPSVAGETFGVSPLEAMATGTVPVVSDLACFRDFIADGETGVVFDHAAPDAAARLAAALTGLLADPARRAAIAGRAIEQAARFTVVAIADLHLADYERMVAE